MNCDTNFLIACGLIISGILFCVTKISSIYKEYVHFQSGYLIPSDKYTWMLPNDRKFEIWGSGGTDELKLLGVLDNGEWKPKK